MPVTITGSWPNLARRQHRESPKVCSLLYVLIWVCVISAVVTRDWKLAIDNFLFADSEERTLHMDTLTQQFYQRLDLADMYYVFLAILCFIEQPFTSFMPEALLNMARYLTLKTLKTVPKGISKVYPNDSVLA